MTTAEQQGPHLVEQIVTDDLDLLLEALPPSIRESLQTPIRRADLLEIVLDLGRLHEARYPGREVVLKITEDDLLSAEHEVQKMTDAYIKKVDEMLAAKERDIMEV